MDDSRDDILLPNTLGMLDALDMPDMLDMLDALAMLDMLDMLDGRVGRIGRRSSIERWPFLFDRRRMMVRSRAPASPCLCGSVSDSNRERTLVRLSEQ